MVNVNFEFQHLILSGLTLLIPCMELF